MGVKDLFSNSKKYISRKQMRENYRHDPTFQKTIMSDPAMAKILDRPAEQKKVHDLLLEKSKDGKVDVHDMRKIADELAHGRVEDISSAEGRSIARAIFPDSSRRYEHDALKPEKDISDTPAPQNTRSTSQNKSTRKTSNLPANYLTYQPKSISASSDSDKTGNKKTSFFDSMRSVRRNKQT